MFRQPWMSILVLLSLLWAITPSQAIELDGAFSVAPVDQELQYLRDGSGSLDLQQIRQLPEQDWQYPPAGSPSFGFDTAPYWFRFSVHNPTATSQRLLLEIGNPLLDHLTIFIEQDGAVTDYQLGDALPFASRPIAHYNFLVPIDLVAQGSANILIRAQTESAMQLPLKLWSQQQFFVNQPAGLLGQGLYFGVMLVMVVYNLFIFFAVRHRSYIYYTGYVLGMALFISALQGIGYQYLWPAWPQINPHIIAFSAMFFVFCAVGFMQSLLQLQTTSPRHYKLFRLLQWLSVAMALAAPFLPNRITIQPVMILCVITGLGGLTAGVTTLLHGLRSARYYVLAYTWLLLACLVVALGKFGLIPPNWLTQNAIEIGSVIEVVMLSFALADRINVEREQKFIAQRLALENERLARSEQERYLQLRYSAQLEELKSQQALLEAKTESRAKSEFLATMSHEIRTPMNGVLGMAELLQGTRLDEEQQQYVDVIDRSGKALLNIINDILDYSKISAGKMQLEFIPCDLQVLCDECMTLFAASADRKQLALQCQLNPDVPRHIRSDPTRLRQILLNLLGNAFKFTHRGSVQLIVENVTGSDTTAGNVLLKFSVQDTGIGIAPQVRQRLFQPFTQADSTTTREYGGTGLGLSIAQRLVAMMGGRIDVVSQVNQGSTFWFTLPCSLAETPPTREEDGLMHPVPLAGKKILVVEDNAVNQLVIANMLTKLGLLFDFAANGAIAVEKFERHHDQYHMVLMDCEMPVLDGYQATRQMRALEQQQGWAHTPVVALTAHVLQEHRQRSKAAGMDEHVAKPLNLKVLTAVLRRFLQPAAADTELESGP